jgi:CRP-like cAMP-binding protein
MEKIIEVLNSIVALPAKDCEHICAILSSRQLNKGDYWIQEGKRNDDVAFVEDGYLRKFFIKDGVEITDHFYFENDFSADLPSIISNSLPQASIVAMQKTSLTIFSYHQFNGLCKCSHTLEHLHRQILANTFVRFYKRTSSFVLQTPKERYDELIATSPNVVQRATQYHIASYLGISPQHLSRLRGTW